MNRRLLVIRNLTHYWRSHLGLLLATALCVAVLTGALLANDSVKHTLRELVSTRLGRTEFVLQTADRYLSANIATTLGERIKRETAACLVTTGMAISPLLGGFSLETQVIGVSDQFWHLGPDGKNPISLTRERVALGHRLADKLGADVGDVIILRVRNAQLMPGDAPLSVGAEATRVVRLTVSHILQDHQFGAFSLKSHQQHALNAFIQLEHLNDILELQMRANTILVAEGFSGDLVNEQIIDAFREVWSLEDIGLRIQQVTDEIELVSDRVFIDSDVADSAVRLGGNGILSYFVDNLKGPEGNVAYSFVGALAIPGEPLREDQVILNNWAAGYLGAAVGDQILVSYRVPSAGGVLSLKSAEFVVKGIRDIEDSDRTLMPDFPGIAHADSCREWDPGFSLDVSQILDRDEKYWDAYGGSPKAFVSLATGQALWANRYGVLTSVRFPGALEPIVRSRLLESIDPPALGIAFLPIRQLQINASRGGVNFGQLFSALSMFLVVAALLLVGLLFGLGMRHRLSELGTFGAMGLPQKMVAGIWAAEFFVISFLGGLIGLAAGVAYNRALLRGLVTLWRGATHLESISQSVSIATLLLAFTAGMVMSLLTVLLGLRGWLKKSPSLLQGGRDLVLSQSERKRKIPAAIVTSLMLMVLVISLLLGSTGSGATRVAWFFVSATLLFSLGVLMVWNRLKRLSKPSTGTLSVFALGLKNASRRKQRTMTVTLLFALGIFVVAVTGANRRGSFADAGSPASGTGGFQYVSSTVVPVLDSQSVVKEDGVGFKKLESDDASCLNLNRVAFPHILAVPPELLAGRFSFLAVHGSKSRDRVWEKLDGKLEDGSIPAIADQTVITWGLGLKVGDTITYLNEDGRNIRLKLIAGLENSLFQGHLIISEENFTENFPSVAGYRFFLFDSNFDIQKADLESLRREMATFGLSVEQSEEKLLSYYEVENTYLSIFMMLGAFGVLLGTLGFGIVLLKNVAESRSEYAILTAIGYSQKSLGKINAVEHLFSLFWGCILGIAAGFITMIPAIISGQKIPLLFLLIIIGIVITIGLLWTMAAFRLFAPSRYRIRNE